MQIIQNYLNKRGITGPWKIDPQPQKKFYQAVVLPAFGEAELIPHTLSSLNKNDTSILGNTLVVVVVNNAVNSPESILKNNQTTLNILKSLCKYHNGDRTLSGEIESIAKKIKSGEFVHAVTKNIILE